MSNLREIGLSGIVRSFLVVGSDGRSLTLTKNQIQAFYQTTTGNAAARRAAVITWVRGQITAEIGAEMIDALKVDFDFSPVDGSISRFEVAA